MEDNAKNASSYHLDQEILDGARLHKTSNSFMGQARGIDMTVEEVAGLSTCKYSERVKTLKLSEDDLAFLKGLRRRIKNRLASQNSRRRSVEQLRRLTRELRAVRACRDDALAERRALLLQRDTATRRCTALREFLIKTLSERSDPCEVPSIHTDIESQKTKLKSKKLIVNQTISPPLSQAFKEQKIERDKSIFECSLDKLVQQSVHHIFKTEIEDKKSVDLYISDKDDTKKIFAKTVFISNQLSSDVKSVVLSEKDGKKAYEESVLNLSVKGGRRGHGRKQTAPRRIAYAFAECEDTVLDLKIKKEDK